MSLSPHLTQRNAAKISVFFQSLIGGRSTDRVSAILQTNRNTLIALSIVAISDPNGKRNKLIKKSSNRKPEDQFRVQNCVMPWNKIFLYLCDIMCDFIPLGIGIILISVKR